MSLKNSEQGYGLVGRVNHWATASVFIVSIVLGMVLEDMERGDTFFQLMGLHKGLAILLMGLVLFRLVWLSVDHTRVMPEPGAQWQLLLAKGVRWLLWLGMIGMPISGWLMSNSAGHSVGFFGLFDLPVITPESEAVNEIAGTLHAILPKLLIAATLLHLAGALKHHLLDRDGTLLRMTKGAA